jgi:hypothetical protein
LEEVTALPSCDVSLVDLHWEHLKKFLSFCAGVWGISSRNYAEKKKYENDEQNENTAVRPSFGKKRKYQENKPRVSWTATSISSIPQKIKCNRGVPKEIGPKITDFLRDIEPGFYYPVRETLKRNPKSMQTGCRYAGNICTEENGSG